LDSPIFAAARISAHWQLCGVLEIKRPADLSGRELERRPLEMAREPLAVIRAEIEPRAGGRGEAPPWGQKLARAVEYATRDRADRDEIAGDRIRE
jgi:hypothetical protein